MIVEDYWINLGVDHIILGDDLSLEYSVGGAVVAFASMTQEEYRAKGGGYSVDLLEPLCCADFAARLIGGLSLS